MKYRDGTAVREGDMVLVHQGERSEIGIVVKIVLPATDDAGDWSLPKGGVVISGVGLGILAAESLENDEDIDFVGRAPQ